MEKIYWVLTTTIFVMDLAIRIGLSLRVIMRKRSPSVSLAWLVIVLLLPFAGAIIYLLFGETRIGERRAIKLLAQKPLVQQWTKSLYQRVKVDWNGINPECIPIDRQVNATIGIPTMPDNDLELFSTSDLFFSALIEDINKAQSSCFLEFYIYTEGGLADEVSIALIQAQERGVTCRLLLDSIGSRDFLRSQRAKRMQLAGIEIVEALPAGLFRALFVRIDLRNHRKIAIIDGSIAYTGSHNLTDPKFFKQDHGIGEWVDTMVRIRGPVVEIITAAFIYDWILDSQQDLEDISSSSEITPNPPAGNALVQLVPSGPGLAEDTLHNLLLTTIYAARSELLLTTPYFVPDNAILAALRSAAQKGVRVTIIIPERNDSKLVHYASRARLGILIKAGVRIMAFSGGLLHAKTITVDRDFCLFGSVNLDMRSFWLNFEMTLCVYDKEFTQHVRKLQHCYLTQSRRISPDDLTRRSFFERLKENTALLVSPLL
ncbi:cardiolipin synthase [Desulfogranum japonicum]|uniref:cardiolipin synthase n=1 Tax=Desulfogranum japonicum TaxID=231447 RepID=UPI00048C631B|nr:cardiolipin synthase [Desulfogranum japonicum]